MYQIFKHVGVRAIASCVPKNVVGNAKFSHILNEKELRIFEKTVGIKERRWAEENVTASDLGFKAAEQLFSDNAFYKEDIKCLIFLSQTADYKIPFTSNILQDRLGLGNDVLCLDLNAGCAGFVQGLSTAFAIADTIEHGKVLLIVAETLSKILSPNDRGTTMLFGDGATALIISKDKKKLNESYFNFFTDGSQAKAIQIPEGGYRNVFNERSLVVANKENGNERSNLNLEMDGQKVFDFTLREIANSLKDLLAHFSLEIDKIDYFFFHQSNQFIIKQIANQLQIPLNKVPINIEQFGNTSGVSLGLLLTQQSMVSPETHTSVFSGYGAGLSWGNVILNFDEHFKALPLIEY